MDTEKLASAWVKFEDAAAAERRLLSAVEVGDEYRAGMWRRQMDKALNEALALESDAFGGRVPAAA